MWKGIFEEMITKVEMEEMKLRLGRMKSNFVYYCSTGNLTYQIYIYALWSAPLESSTNGPGKTISQRWSPKNITSMIKMRLLWISMLMVKAGMVGRGCSFEVTTVAAVEDINVCSFVFLSFSLTLIYTLFLSHTLIYTLFFSLSLIYIAFCSSQTWTRN